ncbi:MAG: DNA-binding domain-containing protein [Pseudomonadota bacterium]|nr:DNA-binding domain-containing protein [Pseudomonadota bacterium]
MPELRDFQAGFARELWSRGEGSSRSALAAQPGFSVYRNTVMAACIDALTANYPTVHELIGADCFNDAATAFVRECPPSSGVLAGYGQGFAKFLSSLDAVAELEYLPGVAMLDRFWTEAHFAADGTVLDATDLAGLTPEGLSRTCFVLHPTARWQTFETMPIYSLWQRHRDALPLDAELDWRGESALVTRPEGAVAWTAIPRAAAVFLSSCASGGRFDQAMDAALGAGATDDASWLRTLIHAGAFARLEGRP